MIRRPLYPTLALVTSLFALGACDKKSGNAAAAAPAPPASVGVVTLSKASVPLYIESVATLDGYVNADIRARVRGYLKSQNYKDGATVKEGDVLFTIDASEWSAAAAAAKANLSRAQTAQARAKTELDRGVGLFQTGTLSQQDLDNTKASVDDAKGQVSAAQAALDQANLNLGYTTIRSPITGVAGLAQVRVGNLVGQDGPTLIATVSQTNPIRVTFPISENDYVRNPERFKNLDQRDLKWAQAAFDKLEKKEPVEGAIDLVLSDGSVYPHKGVIVSVNRSIDTTTGTIQLQALIPNPDGFLRVGQYGRVRLPRGKANDSVLAVPEKALIAVQGQYSIGVVGGDNKVSLKKVELGASTGSVRIVNSGVAEGDRIVIEGTQRVTDGAVVDPHPVPMPPVAVAQAGAPSGSAAAPGTAAPGAGSAAPAPAQK